MTHTGPHGSGGRGREERAVIWTRSSRSSVTGSRQRGDDGEDQQVLGQEVLHKLMAHASTFIKKCSILQFSWKKWDSVSKSYYSMGHSQQEANQTVLHKENTGSLKGVETKQTHSSLGTGNHRTLGWDALGAQSPELQLPQAPGHYRPYQAYSWT